MVTWRYRKCPYCERVFPAGELPVIGSYEPGWAAGKVARQCPRCGWAGQTREFQVVREVHPGEVSYAPVKLPPLEIPRCEVCGARMSVARAGDTCGGLFPCRKA